jgi:hypothetical protein
VLAPKIKILRSWLVMSKEQAKLWVEKNAIKETVKYKAEANMKEAKLQGYIENGSYIALVETVASGKWGCKMPEALVPFFELDITPNDEWVWEAIDGFSSDLASVLTEELGLPGSFYFSSHEADGSYCLWYTEDLDESSDNEEDVCIQDDRVLCTQCNECANQGIEGETLKNHVKE